MDGISGVTNSYGYDESWPLKQNEKADQSESIAGSRAGASAATQVVSGGESLVSPSLLVAVQETDVTRETGDGEEESGALFTQSEETEEDQLIAEILEKGLADWAHEKWLERIREKARQAALAEMGLTEGDLANMTPAMQEQIERIIEEKVEEAIRSALDEATKENGEHRQADAMVVSPILTGG